MDEIESNALFESLFEAFQITPDLNILSQIDNSIVRAGQQHQEVLESQKQHIIQLQKEQQLTINRIKALSNFSTISPEILEKLTITTHHDSTGEGAHEGTGSPPAKTAETTATAQEDLFKLIERKASQLDDSKVLLAKNLNDLESQINSMNILITRLNESIEKLNAKSESILNDNLLQNPDSKIMKINLYKSLGLLIENVTNDENDKILIYNKENDVSSVLNVNEKYSDFFITNHIWEKL